MIPNPAQFIYSHFPNEPQWQLLKPLLKAEEFKAYSTIDVGFLKYNIELISHKSTEINCANELDIRLGFPLYLSKCLIFKWEFAFENRPSSERQCIQYTTI